MTDLGRFTTMAAPRELIPGPPGPPWASSTTGKLARIPASAGKDRANAMAVNITPHKTHPRQGASNR